jgi:hypothetical protein
VTSVKYRTGNQGKWKLDFKKKKEGVLVKSKLLMAL